MTRAEELAAQVGSDADLLALAQKAADAEALAEALEGLHCSHGGHCQVVCVCGLDDARKVLARYRGEK